MTEKQLKQMLPFMASLFILAHASNSKRRACAAGIVRWKNGIPTLTATGVNGTESGTSNVCENEDLSMTLPHVVHAEINAIKNSYLPTTPKAILICTDSPCEACMESVAAANIRHIVYCRSYRITDHMRSSGIQFHPIDEDAVKDFIIDSAQRMQEVIC